MLEAQPSEQDVPEKVKKPIDIPDSGWGLPAQHRRPAVLWLIAVLILLQVVVTTVVVVNARKLFDLGERIERLEKSKPQSLNEQ
jgi:hypothetical protein